MKTTSAIAEHGAAVAQRREIGRFLRVARQRGEEDCVRRRRAGRRCQRSWPLLVVLEDEVHGPDMCVALHNASRLGIAFLCPQPIASGTVILIRLFWHDEFSPLVPAVVRHVTRRSDGYLIGCAYAIADNRDS